MRMRIAIAVVLCGVGAARAERFNVIDFGARPDDKTDDTAALIKALEACGRAGGGEVWIPAGTFIVSRQAQESPILEIPSNTRLCGEGASSIVKFDPRVNQTNFWRMLGASKHDCRNVTIRDLHLDGSNTYPSYEGGKTPEQNHGIFFYRKEGVVENIVICNCLIENFSGDCIGIGPGCRGITIRNVTVRNFVRQGIQLAGGNGARDYCVTGCRDLAGSVKPGGSTIHVEHARGLTGVIISDNHCGHSLLAGGVDGLIVRGNIVTGRIVGNNDTNVLIQGNVVRGIDQPTAVVQLGYADGLILKDNIIFCNHPEAGGIHVWGTSRYNPAPSRNGVIAGNVIRRAKTGILLNGARHITIGQNRVDVLPEGTPLQVKRSEDVQTDKASETGGK